MNRGEFDLDHIGFDDSYNELISEGAGV